MPIPEVRFRRQVRLVYRKAGERSHASAAFLAQVTSIVSPNGKRKNDEDDVID